MAASFVYRKVRVRVIEADLTELKVDAIVNPANSHMLMGGGVAGAIKAKGGEEVEVEARKSAPVPIGGAIATRAGRLPSRYVIHAPTMQRPEAATTKDVGKAMKGALRVADDLGIAKLAFPGMGTGVGGLDYYDAGRAMLEAIKSHLEGKTCLKEAILVAWNSEAHEKFSKALNEIFRS